MAEDLIRQYSRVTEELNKATVKVHKLSSLISKIGSLLTRNPYKFVVSNVKANFPAEVTMVEDIPRLNADEWPTAEQIAEVLADLHQKRKAVRDVWHSLSGADQDIVSKHDTID